MMKVKMIVTALAGIICLSAGSFAQIKPTKFEKTAEKFENGEFVWKVMSGNAEVGEFWPIRAINLVTKNVDKSIFDPVVSIDTMLTKLGGVATAPDGMTGGAMGNYQLQGRCLSHGRPCGDGKIYQYGVILVSPNGYRIRFSHMNEIKNFDSLYTRYRMDGATLFFLPSLFRNGVYPISDKEIDKVLIRRETPDGEQIGVVIFNKLLTYNRVREIILGLDRPGKSKTTHIYMLDGGGIWGQSCRKTNSKIKIIGTRNPEVVTNYLVFY